MDVVHRHRAISEWGVRSPDCAFRLPSLIAHTVATGSCYTKRARNRALVMFCPEATMGVQALSSTLVGIVACFPLMTATASQVHPACAPSVALSTDTEQPSLQVTLVRDRIRMSGLKSAEIRSRLANVGYEPSVLDRYLDPTCSVPAPTDTVQHALEALGFMDSSRMDLTARR